MSENSARIIGVGAGALDIYRPYGEVGTDFRPGEKIGWSESEDALLLVLLETGCERHIGGNVLNALAYLSLRSTVQRCEIGMVSVMGEGDLASESIRKHLGEIGVIDRTMKADGYLPSISIIERLEDRMVRGRPRTPLDNHLTDEHIGEHVDGADIVVVASLKSAELARSVFRNTAEDSFLSYNPGSSEVRDYPDKLQAVMRERNPDLLALNDEELLQLFGTSADANLYDIAEKATELAANVLWTRGKEGAVLTQRLKDGRVLHTAHAAALIDKEQVKDTLGAGDRAHAIAIDGLASGAPVRVTLDDIAESTSELIQHTGAHGDLYSDDRTKV
jgi:sugar/nucleoside kinase (ribokinase family)